MELIQLFAEQKIVYIKHIPKLTCHLIIDNLNYCKHCVAVSKTLYTTDGIDADWFERIYYPGKMKIVYKLLGKVAMKMMYHLLLKTFYVLYVILYLIDYQ